MAYPQHVFRRGYIFWWCRIHCLFSGRKLDIRVSLKTGDRHAARDRGAALTAATGGVLTMLEEKIRGADALPSESDLQAMAHALYEELLVEICTAQRSTPYDRAAHSVANLAFADYYQRLAAHGGHMSLLAGEERRLGEQMGWNAQRITDLRTIIRLREDRGISQIKPDSLDLQLESFGYNPDDRNRWMLELALYPHYRDANLEAERKLSEMLGISEPPVPQQAAAQLAPASASNDGACMSELIDQAVRDLVDEKTWDIKSGRQARSTVALFEMLVGRKPFAEYTQAEFASFKRKTAFLPARYDMTSEKSRAVVMERVAAFQTDSRPQPACERKIAHRTRNRHLSSLRSLYRWASKNGLQVPAIKFEDLFIADVNARRGRKERTATPTDDVAKLFALPVFTGCLPHRGGTGALVLGARFRPGGVIMHDAFYWVPLLLYYTGARREEVCKLRPDDIHDEADVAHILIDFTEFGRIKNDHSVRPVPLHKELIRLGFLEFAKECRRRGYDVLFPELRPTNQVQGFGDVYYKTIWANLKRKGELTADATVHGMRHRFATELKTMKVFSEFRRDVMGHAGANINEERYSELGPLIELRAAVDELPSVTSHLIATPMRLPPRAVRKPQPGKKRG